MAKFDKSCFRWYENGTVENIYSGRLCNVVTNQDVDIYLKEAILEMRRIYNEAMLKRMTPEQFAEYCAEIIETKKTKYSYSCLTTNEIEVTK